MKFVFKALNLSESLNITNDRACYLSLFKQRYISCLLELERVHTELAIFS